MCYKPLVMEQASTHAAGRPRQRLHWTFAPALLAAVTTLALIGCTASTPVKVPKFAGSVRNQTYFAGQAIRTLHLPAASGGSGALTYSLSPEVPGLTFDPDERTLSGIPTSPTPPTTYRMTYEVRDANRRTDEIDFTITVNEYALIGSILSAVTSDNSGGVLRLADVPEPNGGPAVVVSGNHVIASGGAAFLDVIPEPGTYADKLLISVGGVSFGYYEVDVQGAATPHRLVGEIRFDLDPAFERGCVAVSAVDSSGAVGPPECHTIVQESVAAGEVEITLSWDSYADLDLHVADPNGDEVYYGSEEVASGARSTSIHIVDHRHTSGTSTSHGHRERLHPASTRCASATGAANATVPRPTTSSASTTTDTSPRSPAPLPVPENGAAAAPGESSRSSRSATMRRRQVREPFPPPTAAAATRCSCSTRTARRSTTRCTRSTSAPRRRMCTSSPPPATFIPIPR